MSRDRKSPAELPLLICMLLGRSIAVLIGLWRRNWNAAANERPPKHSNFREDRPASGATRPVYFTKTTKKTYEFWGKLRQYENGTKIRNSEAKNYGNQNASLVERTQRFRSIATRMASPGIRSDHFDSATDLRFARFPFHIFESVGPLAHLNCAGFISV